MYTVPFSLVDIVVDGVDHLPQLLILVDGGEEGGGGQDRARLHVPKQNRNILKFN